MRKAFELGFDNAGLKINRSSILKMYGQKNGLYDSKIVLFRLELHVKQVICFYKIIYFELRQFFMP